MPAAHFVQTEWIVTNSSGGYGLGNANLINSRKYHGLLISSDRSLKRNHLVSSIEETVSVRGAGFPMDSSNYPGTVFPEGYRHIDKFFPRPYPVFAYRFGGAVILKSIRMHPSLNAVAVKYKNAGAGEAGLFLRPKFTLRNHHSINAPGRWDEDAVETSIDGRMCRIASNGIECCLYSGKGDFELDFTVYRNVIYPAEIMRGYPGTEDLAAPFKLQVELEPGEEFILAFSGEPLEFSEICEKSEKRYIHLPLPENHPDRTHPLPAPGPASRAPAAKPALLDMAQYLKILKESFTDFLVDEDLIAGFPWFSAWGRDTMTAIEALRFIPGSGDAEEKILLKYGSLIKDGIIPNTIGEGGEGGNYDTADASLWYGIRVMEFIKRTRGSSEKKLFGFVSDIILNYINNPFLPFTVDPGDGLVVLRPGTNLGLTWMDARVYGMPVTPRYGKPVEINGLWYNLLKMFAETAKSGRVLEIGEGRMKMKTSALNAVLRRTSASMLKFFDGENFCDRITEHGTPSKELRPNYLICTSLPRTVFSREALLAGYNAAKRSLLTPYGLRSLAPEHPAFRSRYMGNQTMRDLAYHQGTTWPWLLLPMAKTAVKAVPRNKIACELEPLVDVFRRGFMEGKMASVPEIYDGEHPGLPKGCPAQCWSVAAVLCIENIISGLKKT